MPNICPGHGCGKVHHLSFSDEGQTFRCAECGTTLHYEEGTLRLASEGEASPSPPRADGSPPSATPKESSAVSSSSPDRASSSPLLTLLFGVGTFLIILFLFLPILDQTRIMSLQAAIDMGDRKSSDQDGVMKMGSRAEGEPDKAKADKEKKPAPDKEKESWEKRRKELQEQKQDRQLGAKQAVHYYTWGMMVGFLMLAIASVGFLGPKNTQTRRVVGAIVVTAQILLVFIVYLASSTTARYMP